MFPDEAYMQGTIRSYNEEVNNTVVERIKAIAEGTAEAMGCKANVNIDEYYPPTINTEKETNNVYNLAK